MAQHEDFFRIKQLPPYVFEEVNSLKAALRRSGRDIIDLGMGNPDMPTPDFIVDKLVETVRNPRTHRYSVSRGIAGLRKAMARYYERRFDVALDPDRQIVATLGSKEGFANLAQAITAPGDIILSPNPAYPIHAYGFIIAGGEICAVPALTPEAHLRGLHQAIGDSRKTPRAMVINYPSNPTAQTIDLDFYTEIVALARRHDILVLSDLAYSEIYFETPPPSIFQVPGAIDLAVEVNSLSKSFAMAGWRVGMAVGNERMISALARVKSYLDYGAFTPIQVAASAALDAPDGEIEKIRAIYRARRDILVSSFATAGWDIPVPAASMFAWAAIPANFRDQGSVAFAKHLMETADIAVAPGLGFGEHGDGHVRIGLVENEQRIRQAARNVKRLLAKAA
ncbi:MAG: LL-diaminopimelate aminotransferase [Pseudomonadota bacterium]